MKEILDACCGGKHLWFNKKHPNALYMDIRQESKGTIKLQPNWSVEPDVLSSYCNMPFGDRTFRLVIWDIPHKLKKDTSIICKKYGFLGDNYKQDLKDGFSEIMRVLHDYGILEFKYADLEIPVQEMLALFPIKPLFGTVTKKGVNNTFWFCFMKIPEDNN